LLSKACGSAIFVILNYPIKRILEKQIF